MHLSGAGTVPTVRVRSTVDRSHVVAEKHSPPAAEMEREVYGLVAGVGAVPKSGWRELNAGVPGVHQVVDPRMLQLGKGEDSAGEDTLDLGAVLCPPPAIAEVQDVRPWRESKGSVDDDHAPAAELLEVDISQGWSTAEDEDGLAGPEPRHRRACEQSRTRAIHHSNARVSETGGLRSETTKYALAKGFDATNRQIA